MYAARISLVVAVASAACGGDDAGSAAPGCVEVDPQCTPAFDPTWDNVYEFVIGQSCGGSEGVACHGGEGKQGGLVLYPQTQAFQELLGGSLGHGARVLPGNAACSVLVERLATTDRSRWMPYGAGMRLSERERCAVERWIDQGAAE